MISIHWKTILLGAKWAEYVTESNFDENDDETEKYNIEKLLGPNDLDNYSYMGYPNFFPG